MGPLRNIEYRLLLFTRYTAGEERLVIGVVHWDGASLRSAWGPKRIPRLDSRADVVAVLRDYQTRAVRASPGFDLAATFPVREGDAGLLSWTPVKRARSSSPVVHFNTLVGEYNLSSAF